MTLAALGLVAVAVGLSAYSVHMACRAANQWLGYLHHRDDEARAEREVLYRVLLSRTAGEFGSLDRIRQTPLKGRPSMTQAEYDDMLRDDMVRMGVDDRAVVPGVPEGL